MHGPWSTVLFLTFYLESSTMSNTTTANPAPLGLMGFGMTTVLLNIHNAGFFPIDAMILAMGIFYGGLSQVIVGIMCFKRGDTFGTTAFTSYGLFWLTLVGLLVLPKMGLAEPSPHAFMGWYLALWGLFTAFMFVGSLRYPTAKQVVFGSLTILFALLALRDFTGSELIGTIAGYEGIFCGLSAIYFAMAQVLNAEYGRTILPVGRPMKFEDNSAPLKVAA
jgi:succinate-acetate transporter protein